MSEQVTLKAVISDTEKSNLVRIKNGELYFVKDGEIEKLTPHIREKLSLDWKPQKLELFSGEKIIASSEKNGTLPPQFIDDYLYFHNEGNPIVEMVLIDMDGGKKGWQNKHKSGIKGNIYPN